MGTRGGEERWWSDTGGGGSRDQTRLDGQDGLGAGQLLDARLPPVALARELPQERVGALERVLGPRQRLLERLCLGRARTELLRAGRQQEDTPGGFRVARACHRIASFSAASPS